MHYGLATDLPVSQGVPSPSGHGSYEFARPQASVPVVRGPKSDALYVFLVKMPSYSDAALFAEETRVRTVKLAEATDRWRRHVLDPRAADDVDSLTETVEAVLDVIAEVGPSALSLRGLHSDRVQPEHLAAVLRSSSSWRDEVPGWDEALKVAIAAVRRAKLDAEDVLFGLL